MTATTHTTPTEGWSSIELAVDALVRQATSDQQALAEMLRRFAVTIDSLQGHLVQQRDATLAPRADEPRRASAPSADQVRAALVPDAAASPAHRVVISLLGGMRLAVDGRDIEEWSSGKARSLFAYLALNHDRPVSREALTAALWPEADGLSGGTSLKVAVHALRQLLIRSNADAGALQLLSHPTGYQLKTNDLWLDVDAFERSCANARRLEAQGRQAEAAEQYAQAEEVYGGDFLGGSTEDWALLRLEGLKDQYLGVLAWLADAAFATGDYHGCIRRCQKLLEQDNCREDSYRLLILCHDRLGQPGRARRWYELCIQTLHSELDAEPEPETVALYQRIIRGEA